MKIVFLDAKTIGDDIDLSGFDSLGEVTRYNFTTSEEAPERVRDADILIINKVPVNEQTIHTAANLKLVCVTATGTNNLDKDYLASRGIAWRNVAGYSTETVTQHTFAMLFYLLEKLLNQMRLSVVTAADAETALSLFEKGMHPALVITDQKLPGIQGIAFARLVRKRFPRMPIILCSSCSAMHDAQSCHMGADEDIQRFLKPFDPQRLKEAVDRALQPKTGRWIWRAF